MGDSTVVGALVFSGVVLALTNDASSDESSDSSAGRSAISWAGLVAA